MKNKKTRRFKIRYIVFGLLGVMALAALVFMRFGGFGTGENVNPEEFLAYAEPVENITVPESAKIIALGEATHGNAEFQQLKLEVFKLMVKNNGVRAFALEGDYGGCEQVNRYIHGGEGTAQEAAAAIGFSIYRTEEMAELISYMRQYNESALEGEDLRFYGFDMQRISYSMRFLKESCKELEVDTTNLQKLVEGKNWSSECDLSTRTETLTQVKKELESKNGSENAIHFVDILMQHSELQTLTNDDGATLRDQFMAENVQWILQQEQRNGHEKIFVTGHNSHVAKWGSFDSMGKLLSKDAANGYYVIGTDFYKTHCNMPTRSPEKRTIQVFYSHDPLAKAAKLAGFDICWLDFTKVPENSELGRQASEYTYMGTLGESYSIIMRLLPPSYRMFQPPAELYDSMIFVTDANPTKILENNVCKTSCLLGSRRERKIGISGGVFMPQMNKGGKFIFGKSLIRTDGTLRIPPQAMEEYHIADEGKVYLFTGSKITGGFCVTRKGLLHPSKLGHILDDTPPLLDYSAGSGEFIKYKGRSYCWVEISQEGQILLTKKMMDFLKVRPGMELLSIRSSDIAFTMGAKGPLLEKAENYDGEIPLFKCNN